MNETYLLLKQRLAKSTFRSRFKLNDTHRRLLAQKGWNVIAGQTEEIIRARLAPAYPYNDGKQTPMRGFPVFIAQHATGTCCRSCLMKWHNIPQGRELTEDEIFYIRDILLEWLKDHAGDLSAFPVQEELF